MGRRKKTIVKNVNANIPVSLSWFLLPFLTFLCFPASAQSIDSSLQWPNSVSLQKRGYSRLWFCDSVAGLNQWIGLRQGSKGKPRKAEETMIKTQACLRLHFEQLLRFLGPMLRGTLVHFTNKDRGGPRSTFWIGGGAKK